MEYLAAHIPSGGPEARDPGREDFVQFRANVLPISSTSTITGSRGRGCGHRICEGEDNQVAAQGPFQKHV